MTIKNTGYVFAIIIIALVAVFYLKGTYLSSKITNKEYITEYVDLVDFINSEIEQGKEKSVVYISGISTDEIAGINNYITTLNGTVDKYSITQKTKDGLRVTFMYNISDNYYVLQKYKYGTEIPDTNPRAEELYNIVNDIISENISLDMSDYDKELALHDYLVTHCSYDTSEDPENVSFRAYGALAKGSAVCNGYAEAMALMLSCAGIENEIMTGNADGELHAWNRVLIDGEWYQLDATWDDPIPDRDRFAGHMYFNVTDDIMDDTHSWDESSYSACNSLDDNYFYKNNLICNYVQFENAAVSAALTDANGIIEVALTDYTEDYDLNFLWTVNGINSAGYSTDILGDYTVITLYFNKSNTAYNQ